MDWTTAKAEYDRDGFYVIDDLLHSDEVDDLLAETAQICRGARGVVPVSYTHLRAHET